MSNTSRTIMDSAPKLTIITDSHCFDHDTGGLDHPDSPVRLEVIIDSLHSSPLIPLLDFQPSRMASREELLFAHDESWLFRFEEAVLSGKTHIDHPDNQICYESFGVAALAAGAGLKGIDIIESSDNQDGLSGQAFCIVRPPGHHAERSKPYGLCFYNNALVATRYWQKRYRRRRVAVLDFDAHHGNGIQAGLEQDAESLYISIHEHPSFSYPGTGYEDEIGIGEGRGTVMNIPLAPGAGDEQLLASLYEKVAPALEAWKPDAFIVSAGFDGHIKDEMSGLAYSTEVYHKLGLLMVEFANKYAGGRLLSILEGGYELSVLGPSVQNYVAGLLQSPLCVR